MSVPALTCLAGFATLLLLLVVYIAGYFALSVTQWGATPDAWCRIYPLQWQAEIYKPAAKVESAVTGDDVSTYWQPANP